MQKRAKTQGADTDQTTNKATPVNPNTKIQSEHPTGSQQVDQQQIQSNKGNLPNEKGSVQGEAGSRKVQKPLYHFGYIKVNMSDNKNFKLNNKFFCFLFECKERASKSSELMQITYPSGEINGFKFTYSDKHEEEDLVYFVIIWRLPFNIGMSKIAEKLGNKILCVKVVTLIIMPNDLETRDLKTIVTSRLNCMLENDVRILSVADEVNSEQERKKNYSNNTKSMCNVNINFD